MSNEIELKSINELFGMNFYIPAYQRGYRWNIQQVKDLLEDIQEFIDKKKEGFYCIQPLVVKRSIPDGKINDFKVESIVNILDPISKINFDGYTGTSNATYSKVVSDMRKELNEYNKRYINLNSENIF